ncbi:glycosyltransferase [Salegentibacter salegens]|uniref:Glycosyl transferase family 2 n=1 Tax=Salegentibacter salegens TaxID=143223 RepID=A0A1M7IM72_9FLAO|nr:glycosyltransferase [Salegentibacter salegens]PRX42476.1 glycosyl transferase family 2 [Salegentibacter salegens]SHM41801.1 Glycosyl transferase family 2 [Salegentibacter salegens]
MTKLKLSIIVPVYNIEEDLSFCLNSILTQDFKDYELLIINDGSTDNSGDICEDYALKDNRINVYHQKNAGVSAARNLGLEKARGEWICFVDGDDELYPNSLTIVFEEAKKRLSQVIIARAFTYEKGKIKKEKYKFDDSFLEVTFDGYRLITEKSYKRGTVWGCLFKRDFLEQKRV